MLPQLSKASSLRSAIPACAVPGCWGVQSQGQKWLRVCFGSWCAAVLSRPWDVQSIVMPRFFQWDTAALAPRAVQSEGTVFKLERHLMGGQDGYLHY